MYLIKVVYTYNKNTSPWQPSNYFMIFESELHILFKIVLLKKFHRSFFFCFPGDMSALPKSKQMHIHVFVDHNRSLQWHCMS